MKFAVIGSLGWAGIRHVEALTQLGHEIVAVVDPGEGCAAQAAEIGAVAVPSLDELDLSSIEAATLALPPPPCSSRTLELRPPPLRPARPGGQTRRSGSRARTLVGWCCRPRCLCCVPGTKALLSPTSSAPYSRCCPKQAQGTFAFPPPPPERPARDGGGNGRIHEPEVAGACILISGRTSFRRPVYHSI